MVQITSETASWAGRLAQAWPGLEIVPLASTDSTNNWLRARRADMQGRTVLVITDYQTAGRGSGTNRWESQEGCNLICSLQVCPEGLPARYTFALSEAMSLGVCLGLEQVTGMQDGGFRIKWPNDVYHGDGKVCGMLIENDLQARLVERSVMGVGINVNQTHFVSDAPNPLSLAQVTGTPMPRMQVLASVLSCTRDCLLMVEQGRRDDLHALYLSRVYRWQEWHRFTDQEGTHEARITDVRPDGHLVLTDREGSERAYAFGEIKYII